MSEQTERAPGQALSFRPKEQESSPAVIVAAGGYRCLEL